MQILMSLHLRQLHFAERAECAERAEPVCYFGVVLCFINILEKKTTLYVLIYVNQYQPMITSMSNNYVYEDVAAVQFHLLHSFCCHKFFFYKNKIFIFQLFHKFHWAVFD